MRCELDLEMQFPAQTLWCWAAVATSVAAYFEGVENWGQCDVVNQELGLDSCCIDGSTTECNRLWLLDRALARVGHWRASLAGPADFAQCAHEICELKRPIGVRVQPGGLGHFVAITGIGDEFDRMLLVKDPWNGPNYISYDQFLFGYQWTDTYFTC